MNQTSENVQNVINIRELIETLWKGKVIIAIVTAIAVFVSVIASFFILAEKYEATAAIAVKPIAVSVSALDQPADIVDYLATMTRKTKADYLQQIKSSEVLDNTIKKLEIKDQSGNYINANTLSSAVTVTDITDTDRIAITVNDKDPEKAALIANTISQSFAEIAAENSKVQIQEVADKIAQQLTDEEKSLLEKKTALNDYRLKNINIDVLKEEETNLVIKIAEYKNYLRDIETQNLADTATLQILENAAQSADIIPSQDYNLSIDLNSDPSSLDKSQVNISPDSLQNTLLAININNTQIRLLNNQNNKLSYEKRIPELESDLTSIQTSITNEEYKYNTVNYDMTVAQITYAAYQQRNREVTVYTASNIYKEIITISSEATAPGGSVSPDKKKNIAIAGVLGFCVSMFFVLFRNYWRKGKVSSPK